MKYNTLGHTGLLVSELCLGTMTFAAGEGMWKPIAGVEQNLADELDVYKRQGLLMEPA